MPFRPQFSGSHWFPLISVQYENQLAGTSDLREICEHHVCVYFCETITDLFKFSADFLNQPTFTTTNM